MPILSSLLSQEASSREKAFTSYGYWLRDSGAPSSTTRTGVSRRRRDWAASSSWAATESSWPAIPLAVSMLLFMVAVLGSALRLATLAPGVLGWVILALSPDQFSTDLSSISGQQQRRTTSSRAERARKRMELKFRLGGVNSANSVGYVAIGDVADEDGASRVNTERLHVGQRLQTYCPRLLWTTTDNDGVRLGLELRAPSTCP